MTEIPSIQWFPGHMAKTRRMIKECLPLVDAVVEIIDARVPVSSRNPELGKLIEEKTRIIVLNKSDMADPSATEKWLKYYKENNIPAISADCKSGKGIKSFVPLVKTVLSDLIEKRKLKGMVGRPLRLMIVGIPNAGKSSFINRMANSRRTKVEDRPGVTRTKQWVKVSEQIELLDMPGVLWPKFEDPAVGEKLAFTGAVKDDILDTEALAIRLLTYISQMYPDNLSERYKIEITPLDDGISIFDKIARKRGMLISGGEINGERASIMILDEFRSAKLGNITLEIPENIK